MNADPQDATEMEDIKPSIALLNLQSDLPRSTWNEHLTEVARTSYRDFLIKIFAEINYGGVSSNRHFYFEPIIMLDPKSVSTIASPICHQQKLVPFTLQMWDQHLVSKVQKCLSNIFTGVRKENIHIMPYEEVQIVIKEQQSGSLEYPFWLMAEATPYDRQNENLVFYLITDSTSTATTLASNLRRNPDVTLRNYPLQLQCKGLALQNPTGGMVRPSFTFNIISLPPSAKGTIGDYTPQSTDIIEEKLLDLQAQIRSLETRNPTNAVPVFSVVKCINPAPARGQSFGFSSREFQDKKEHGKFDLSTGIFTVKTAGIYQFNFSGHVTTDPISTEHYFVLKVDDVVKDVSFTRLFSSTEEFQRVSLSAVLKLKTGEKVGVFVSAGKLYEGVPEFQTRFSGILFLNDDF